MKIAVVGGGISGLGAAWSLAFCHDVTLFESNARFGGHAHTVTVSDGPRNESVDVGFIVYNERNYPNLVALFDKLGVPTKPSNMSFGVSIDQGNLEYEGSLSGLFAQPSNIARRSYWRMLRDIFRFFSEAENLLDETSDNDISLGEYLEREDYSESFVNNHLLPMGAAIWSSSCDDMLKFPAASFVRFFKNHALLDFGARPVWRTVAGGSRKYVERLLDNFRGSTRPGAHVDQILRKSKNVVVVSNGAQDNFDAVVLACHADHSLSILGDEASIAERKILSKFTYNSNIGVLHRDSSLMPHRRSAWASWNFITDGPIAFDSPAFVTYWMNRLQSLESPEDIFVSLNPTRPINKTSILGQFEYAHPQFDRTSLAAQNVLHTIQGQNRVWFCGSYCGNGFHEDGLQAGLEVAAALGSPAPWRNDIIPISPASMAVRTLPFKAVA